ncbi:hypothetical protein WM015_08525 [Bifidobacterium mongoliense]|uniref:hypothetical protein n=1 Tax=Bifidobacterium mongoliense TaxID=518643 RepID=UPI0030F3F889
MAFMAGDFVYVAGNLATDPRVQRFPAHDGMYDEVVWLTVAVNHTDAATEYVELEARGKTKEYIKNLIASPVKPLSKGTFIMAGGIPAKAKGNKRKLKLVVFSSETSLGYDVLNWDRLRGNGQADE